MEIKEFIWTPEDYDPSAFHINDLIILKLKKPFDFNQNVQPVRLPYDKNFASNAIKNCIVSGWGALFYSKYGSFNYTCIYSKHTWLIKKWLITFQRDQLLNFYNM